MKRASSRPRWFVSAIALFAWTGVAGPVSAQTGTISGVVRDASGTPITGFAITVSVFGANACDLSLLAGTQSDSGTGAYTVAGIPVGTHFVQVDTGGSGAPYVDEWYDGTTVGTTDCNQAVGVTVLAGQDTPGIDFYLDAGPGATLLDFATVTPCRVLDTRNPDGPRGGPALVAGASRTFAVSGSCDIPSAAQSVSVNAAVTQSTAAGNLRLYPSGTAVPLVSAINYSAGETRSNNAVIPLNDSGEIAAFVGQSSGTVHFILDVNGYFIDPSATTVTTLDSAGNVGRDTWLA